MGVGAIEKVWKTCHFNLTETRRSSCSAKVNSEDYNNNYNRDFFHPFCGLSGRRSVFGGSDPTASPPLTLYRLPRKKHANLIVHRHRFASSTNCLFMHSAERRFCCHRAQLWYIGWGCHDKCCPLKLHQFTSRMKWGQNILPMMHVKVNLIEIIV